MVFKKIVKDCERVPFWYGFSYFKFGGTCDDSVFYPIPFNIIIGVVRAVWLKTMGWSFKKLKNIDFIFKHYEKQFQQSYKIAYDEGYEAGEKWGKMRAEQEIYSTMAKKVIERELLQKELKKWSDKYDIRSITYGEKKSNVPQETNYE